MQYSPEEIKDKLLAALDKDNNVVNMSAVEQVICILEKYPVTREALERTRIGKYVNEMRKKTTNKELSKRAKKLVRSWQGLINDGTGVNGDNKLNTQRMGVSPSLQVNKMNVHMPRVSPALSAGSSGSINSAKVSPRIPGSRPSTPASRGYRPVTPTGLRPLTPNVRGVKQSMPPRIVVSPAIRAPCKSLTPNARWTGTGITSEARQISTGCPSLTRPKVGSNSSNQSTIYPSGRLITPPGVIQHRPATPKVVGPGLKQSLSRVGDNGSIKVPVCISGTGRYSPVPQKKSVSQNLPNMTAQKIQSKSSTLNVDKTDKTNIANRKRTRSPFEDTMEPHTKKSFKKQDEHHSNDMPNGDVPWLREAMSRSNANTSSPFNGNKTFSSRPSTPSKISESKSSFAIKKNSHLSVKTETPKGDINNTSRLPNKTPKVKTTAQLIAELQEKSGGMSSDTVDKIKSNKIQKEVEVVESNVPAGARPRPRRTPGTIAPPVVTPNTLSKTKTEMVERFLQSSAMAHSSSDPGISVTYQKGEASRSESPGMGNSFSTSDTPDNSIISDPPTKEVDEVDPWSLLPPLNLDDINWDETTTDYVMSEPKPVIDSDIDKLHSEHLPGINGCYDSNGEWKDWQTTLTISSFDNDPLHILPYVDID